jgi:AcrR family transcriptional regulator
MPYVSTTTPDTGGGTRTRLSPDQRREQLLDLGVRLLATRSLDELSIDLLAEEAGISRGLLYHYFGNKAAFHEAVVRHAADDLIAQTAPPPGGEPLERLLVSVTAYVDYVLANFEGYVSLVRGAAGGNETLRGIYENVRDVLDDRIFTEQISGDAQGELIADTPHHRLIVRGWSAMTEQLVISWRTRPGDVTREELLAIIAGALPALIEGVAAP